MQADSQIDGEPWFVAVDACRALGLAVYAGAAVHLTRLDGDERKPIARKPGVKGKHYDPALVGVFGKFESFLTLVSRPGLFKLIQRSNKPEAKEFDRWVRHEVLPQIMDNGGYVMADANMEAVVAKQEGGGATKDIFYGPNPPSGGHGKKS